MKLHVLPDYRSLCISVADEVAEQLQSKPGSVMVFPTGNTPLGLFKELVARNQSGQLSFERAHAVVLDEYAGLAPNDPRSLTDWLKRELLDHVDILQTHIHGFDRGPDVLEHLIQKLGGLDLCVLGLGPNGHLGFNEPGSSFDSRARTMDLTAESITSNAAYWESEERVPRQGMTLGLGTLAEARSLILMVSGAAKRGILSKTMNEAVSPAIPATMLRQMPKAKILTDDSAALYSR